MEWCWALGICTALRASDCRLHLRGDIPFIFTAAPSPVLAHYGHSQKVVTGVPLVTVLMADIATLHRGFEKLAKSRE